MVQLNFFHENLSSHFDHFLPTFWVITFLGHGTNPCKIEKIPNPKEFQYWETSVEIKKYLRSNNRG